MHGERRLRTGLNGGRAAWGSGGPGCRQTGMAREALSEETRRLSLPCTFLTSTPHIGSYTLYSSQTSLHRHGAACAQLTCGMWKKSGASNETVHASRPRPAPCTTRCLPSAIKPQDLSSTAREYPHHRCSDRLFGLFCEE
jgi:hypothetical protein